MTETAASGGVVMPLCWGWKATVQLNYPRRRSGVLRVIQVILLVFMIAFLKRAPETSGHVTFLLAVTCFVFVTTVIIYLAHLVPLHHPQHCPHRRYCCCLRLLIILEAIHDGVSSIVLLPGAILLLLVPVPSPPTAAAAVLTIVLVLLLAVQCAENLVRALHPTQHPHEDQGEEMRQVEQATPSQDSQIQPTRSNDIGGSCSYVIGVHIKDPAASSLEAQRLSNVSPHHTCKKSSGTKKIQAVQPQHCRSPRNKIYSHPKIV